MSHYFSYVDEHEDNLPGFADKIVIRHPDDCTWEHLGAVFVPYLRACGFVFPNHVRFALVDEETNEEYKPSNYYDL